MEPYVLYDKKKWRYSDQDKDGMLNRQEFEYFYHPKEHEVMLPYVAVVREYVLQFQTPESIFKFSSIIFIHYLTV